MMNFVLFEQNDHLSSFNSMIHPFKFKLIYIETRHVKKKLTSGWKKISGPRKRSYPTSTLNGTFVTEFTPSNFFVHLAGSESYFANSRAISGQTYEYLSLIALAVSKLCSGGIPTSLSLNRDWMKYVMLRPAIGMCLIQLPITWPSAWKRKKIVKEKKRH